MRPSVMALEGRTLLSTIVVNNPTDIPVTGQTDLRQAIAQANSDGGGDTIVFSSLFNSPHTITLTGGALELSGTTAGITITGPGANLLSVSGNQSSRVFLVDANVNASISGLTITDGNAGQDSNGGGLYNLGTLSLTDCSVSGNQASSGDEDSSFGFGGGLRNERGTLSMTDCTVDGNTAWYGGGGLDNYLGTATLTNCTISGNFVGQVGKGGGLDNSVTRTLGTFTLADCAVTDNRGYYGGGLFTDGTSTLTNCTISGNSAKSGGGLYIEYGTTALTNVTVSNNNYSGLRIDSWATLANTIVAGNAGDDISGGFSDDGHNLIGGNPLLAALGDYGGPTPTMALLPGSSAIGGGATGPGIPTTDQRGLPRTGHVDIGAFQSQGFNLTPVVGSTPQTVLTGEAFLNPLAVTVTAANPVEPVDGGVVGFAVTPTAGGASAALSAPTAVITNGQAGVTATANAIPGRYTVTATGGAAGQAEFVLANASLVVTTTLDDTDDTDGLVSLREAVAYASSLPGSNTITFDPTVFGTKPQTITVTAGPITLTDPTTTTIEGPGANLLTVSGGGASRVFEVQGGSAALAGLTVADGRADSGGGLDNHGGTLSLADCTVSGNSATFGGGLYNQGTLNLTNCTVSGNSATYGAGGVYNFGTTTLTNCTVSGNSAQRGGGLDNTSGSAAATMNLTNCTVSGNYAALSGGGLENFSGSAAATMNLTNCTVSGNSTQYGGGLNTANGTATLTNTIVAGNSGGDVAGSYTGDHSLIGGDPLLAPLGDYGGPTLTYALLPGSPAIGAGATGPGIPTTDQRGQPRTGHVDIGAFQPNPLIVNTADDGTGSPSGDLSLRQAVNLANLLGGDEAIGFDPTVFATPQTIALDGTLLELKSGSATITGPGANLLTVSGDQARGVFQVDTDVTASISGLTITGGNAASSGGGVANLGTLTLTDCTVSGSSAGDNGGGVANFGTATLTECTVSGNSAQTDFGGGLYNHAGGTLSLTNCTVSGNTANIAGGLANFGTATLTNCTVSGNTALFTLAGGLYNTGGLVLTNTIVAGQTSGGDIFGRYAGSNNLVGGDPLLAALGDYGGPTLTYALLPGSPAIGGGTTMGAPATDQRGQPRAGHIDIGAFQVQAAALVVNSTAGGVGSDPGRLSLRQAVNLAGALAGAETITFDPAAFATPQTITLTAGPLVFTDKATITITGPGAPLLTISGGGQSRVFDLDGGSAVLSGLTVTGGKANYGAGLYNDGGTLSMTDCTVSGNSATGVNGNGGGLNNNGTTTLTNCTFSGNSVTGSYGQGGGLYTAPGRTTTLTNCTFSSNSANTSNGVGGGLGNNHGTTTLTNCTFSSNSAWYGGGLYTYGGTATLANTIVAGNTGDDIFGGFTDDGHNLIGGNPLLAPLGDYGGPTPTMALLPGSPALGGGTTAGAPTTDQRGLPRSGRVDIGAFQSQGFTLLPVAGSTPEATLVGTAFEHPLAVTVTATNQVEPVDGGVIRFAAPPAAGGASAALSAATATIQPGQACVTATANAILGSYAVTASVAGVADSGQLRADQHHGRGRAGNAVAQPVAAVAGRAFINVVVATFTDSDPNASPSDFLAAIAWGDGITTSSTTVIADGQGRFQVLGTHTYVDTGTYTFSVQVTENSGASATATSTAAVTADANTEAPSPVLTTPRDGVEQFDDLTSLRQAVAYADSHPGPDTITFDPDPSGKKRRTIKLIGGPLVLTNPATTTIIGPGARRLTLSGGGKSRVFDIEGGSLALEGLTIAGGRADRGGGILNDGGTLVLDHVVIRGNRARMGGGIYNDGTTTLTDVVIRGNTARVGSGLFSNRNATLTWGGLSRPVSTSTIVVDHFNGKGAIPTNWKQFAGQPGDVVEKLHNLTITDSTGNSAGIASTAKTVPFNPVGVKTTIVAKINSLNSNDNAFFGRIGLNAQDSSAR